MNDKDGQGSTRLLDTAEGRRIATAHEGGWRRWGPYLAERQWGTVREDYSADGDAWAYFPHEHARSRAYRWGEDGIAGFSDSHQHWCLSLGLWNGRDDILKERMFGLSNPQGNHGEDVKELWWYLDAVPSHAYLKMLYKYPQAAFPYADLLAENGRRKGKDLPEYELTDTGIFAEKRYFDITVEYAKAGPDDILMRVTALNHGPETASLHVLPQLLARNTWSWSEVGARPLLSRDGDDVQARMDGRPLLRFSALQDARMLFCENETNTDRLYGTSVGGAFKDAIGDAVMGRRDAGALPESGTKCAALDRRDIGPQQSMVWRFRLAPDHGRGQSRGDIAAFDGVFAARRAEADEFYGTLQRDIAGDDARAVQRQALAGLIWSKQSYHFNVPRWLAGDPTQPPPPPERLSGRNSEWIHLDNADIISMPDKWEYPWYASWDLAFHCVTMALVDPAFAKGQLLLLAREWYMHPSGQLPAYEWAFGDANPPVQAWAALRVYRMDEALTGKADRSFLERIFHKLILNFTWWVNRKDEAGRNLFEGGFLGLDNIGLFDRSKPLPTGGTIEQADGTAWMAMYSLNLMRIALELAVENDAYEDIASKFFEHFLYIASAITRIGDDRMGLWDETDQFYYDALKLPDGRQIPLRVRSLVGLIPLCAVEVLDADIEQRFPAFSARARWMLENRPDLTGQISRYTEPGQDNRLLLSLLRRHRMTALLGRLLDEGEFLSPHGVRSLSKAHGEKPFVLDWENAQFDIDYEPGLSRTNLFGGNSNWRGPVWMPLNYMLIEALHEFERFYGDTLQIPCPTGSGANTGLSGVTDELTRRLTGLFLRDANGRRAVFGDNALYQDDPAFKDLIPFHEFFHGETGEGLGAMHQTGWTSLVALLLQPRRAVRGADVPSAPKS